MENEWAIERALKHPLEIGCDTCSSGVDCDRCKREGARELAEDFDSLRAEVRAETIEECAKRMDEMQKSADDNRDTEEEWAYEKAAHAIRSLPGAKGENKNERTKG